MKVEEIKHNHLKDYPTGQKIYVENLSNGQDPKTKKPIKIYKNAGVLSLVGVWGDWVEWLTQEDKVVVERLSHLKKTTKLHVRT